MNQKGKYTDVFIFAAILIVVMGIMFYFLFGQFNKMINTNNDTQSINLLINQESATFDKLIQVKNDLSVYERELYDLKKLMPKTLNESSMTDYINKVVQKGNGNILDMIFETPVSKEDYFSRNITFSVSAEYNGLLYILDKLQNSEKLVIINSVDIVNNVSDSGVTAKISATMFFTGANK